VDGARADLDFHHPAVAGVHLRLDLQVAFGQKLLDRIGVANETRQHEVADLFRADRYLPADAGVGGDDLQAAANQHTLGDHVEQRGQALGFFDGPAGPAVQQDRGVDGAGQ
jgi:hypothetical protein